MQALTWINFIVSVIFCVSYLYQYVYIPVAWFKKEKPHKPTTLHRYAVLISARNEELVLGGLIDSVRQQDYPSELIDIYVVADNCTDHTAQVAREAGAIVFERFDQTHVGKGYALHFLLEQIHRDRPGVYDAFLVFDADNILSENYFTEINKTFSDGYRVITSYRNSKNYGDNWISAGYSLWFLRDSRYLNYPRHLLGSSCVVSGTGFLFSREILEECGGWNFFLMTEDTEFTAYHIVRGEKIGFCRTAEFYDEQPTKFKQSWQQRLRWSRGYLQVVHDYGGNLVKGMVHKRIALSCFDFTMSIFPAFALSTISVILNVILGILALLAGGSFVELAISILKMLAGAYFLLFAIGLIATISEWKKIYTSTFKKILYAFTFPFFMFTFIPIAVEALFVKTEWKPIEHNHAKSLKEIQESKL